MAEDARIRTIKIGVETTHSSNQNSEFRRGEGHELCFVDQPFFCGNGASPLEIVSKAVGKRFENSKGSNICLLLCSVCPSWSEGNGD